MLKINKDIRNIILLLLVFIFIGSLYIIAVPGIPMNSLIFELRFNKWLTLSLVGGLSGLASYITQILISNKKADASTLGIGAVNILMIALFTTVFSATTLILWKDSWFILLIFGSSLIGITLIWLAVRYLFRDINYLLITGLVLTLFSSSLAYIIIDKLLVHEQQTIANYLIGSLLINSSKFNIQQTIGIFVLAVSVLYLLIFGEKIVIASGDEEKATSLGVNVHLHKIMAILIIALASSASFILVGNIMFIGFAVGNINYLLFRTRIRFSAIAVVLIGASITTLSYWLFNYIFEIGTYEGVYMIVTSGIVLFGSILFERMTRWRKKN